MTSQSAGIKLINMTENEVTTFGDYLNIEKINVVIRPVNIFSQYIVFIFLPHNVIHPFESLHYILPQ